MILRPYQENAFEAALVHMRRSVMPGLLELATGAGKSHIAAAIARWVNKTHGKRVLCIQPTAELTKQNHEKYMATGERASIFSASAGGRCIKHPVIFGTPLTIKNSLNLFGDAFGAVIIDEAHGITPTIKEIVGHIQQRNTRIRVIGMTATPYRMQTGYIYQYDVGGLWMEESDEPYFSNLLYRVTTQELIEQGYLTPAHAEIEDGYDASGLVVNANGKFDASAVDAVFVGRGRLTSEIVADVVSKSRNRRGVMLFAATVDHAKEILESLPKNQSRMLGGDVNMNHKDRQEVTQDFKAIRYKYLVSIGTLTTGFDATHVDVIGVLRATESPGLFQQIIGRGLRLHPDKSDCIVLDYAGNIERHSLESDLFAPDVRPKRYIAGGESIIAKCPECQHQNKFSARKNEKGYAIDEEGYFIDASGVRVGSEYGPTPGHMGRRCTGQVKSLVSAGVWERCGYRWTSKTCVSCDHENDIAARYCQKCKAELVDPNSRLRIDYAKIKKDPYRASVDDVLHIDYYKTVSKAGNDTLRVDIKTDCRSFSIWINPEGGARANAAWQSINRAIYNGHVAPDIDTFLEHIGKSSAPKTVTAYRQRDSRFFRVIAWNQTATLVNK
jgi:DNA repair protein RadD